MISRERTNTIRKRAKNAIFRKIQNSDCKTKSRCGHYSEVKFSRIH